MANVFYEKQYIIDTAGSTLLRETLAPGESLLSNIKGIQWVGATTAGHQCVIQSSDNIVYWESVASGANFDTYFLIERVWQKDFKVVTLGSGRLYIYLASGKM